MVQKKVKDMGNKTRRRKKTEPGTTWCLSCETLVPDSRYCINCGVKLGEVKGEMAETG